MVFDDPTSAVSPDSGLPEPVLRGALDLWAQSGTRHIIPVHGSSMRPVLREGDQVQIRHGQQHLRRGDIVAYRQNGVLIIHRLVKHIHVNGEKYFLLKGDNTKEIDSPVPLANILGCAVAFRRTHVWLRLDNSFHRTIGWIIALSYIIRQAICRRIRHLAGILSFIISGFQA